MSTREVDAPRGRRTRCSVVVLAGGRARRFGADKLGAELQGVPLLHHALRAVAKVSDEIVVVYGPQGGTVPLPDDLSVALVVVTDTEPHQGPLAALLSGAETASGDRLLVVGGDMPRLQARLLERLVTWPAGRAGACLEHAGRIEPLPLGLERHVAIAAARIVLGSGARSLRALLAATDVEVLEEHTWRALDPAALSLVDVDDPTALAALATPPDAAAADPAVRRFFDGDPVGFAVFGQVSAILGAEGGAAVRVSRSQVAFRRRRGFAYLWRPSQYLARAAAPVVVSIALGRRVDSPRFKEVVQPSTRHWMHHLEIHEVSEVDDEVAGWLREAAERAG